MKTSFPRRPALIALVFLLISGALTLFITSPQRVPTGDEPYYLLTTHSLVVDGDVSLGENHRNRDYRLFYPGVLPGRATVGADGIKVLPAHGLGLSLFLVPFYFLGYHFFPAFLVPFLRLILCTVASLCVYFLLALGNSLGNSPDSKLLVVAGISLSSPFLFYSNLFYPEIFALLSILIALQEFLEMDRHPLRSTFILALIPAVLVWFHPKYLILAFLILLISFFRFGRLAQKRAGSSKIFIPILYLLLSLVAMFCFFWFLHSRYGSWSPDIIYAGDRKDTGMLESLRQEGARRFLIMGKIFIGIWVDQRFGILPYAPLYLAAIPAGFWIVKSRRTEAIPALILFGAHSVVLSWSAPLGGFAPPSRHFVVMIPFLALLVFVVIEQWNRWQKVLFFSLELVGWFIALLMLVQYRLLFTNVTWRNPDELSPFWKWLHFERWIPQMTTEQPNHILVFSWLVGLFLLSLLLYPGTRHVHERHSTCDS
jgi:hypothetical protein